MIPDATLGCRCDRASAWFEDAGRSMGDISRARVAVRRDRPTACGQATAGHSRTYACAGIPVPAIVPTGTYPVGGAPGDSDSVRAAASAPGSRVGILADTRVLVSRVADPNAPIEIEVVAIILMTHSTIPHRSK